MVVEMGNFYNRKQDMPFKKANLKIQLLPKSMNEVETTLCRIRLFIDNTYCLFIYYKFNTEPSMRSVSHLVFSHLFTHLTGSVGIFVFKIDQVPNELY